MIPHNNYRKTRGIIRRDTRANQPLATEVLEGTLYFVTDESIIERSSGAAWESYSPAGGGGGGSKAVVTTTAIGTQNDFDPGSDADVVVLTCNNASALEISGIIDGGEARLLYIFNIGSSTVRVLNEDAGSTAINRISTPSARGQIIGGGGAMLLAYDNNTQRWLETLIESGDTIPVPYNAADFSGAGGMTWTVQSGDVSEYAYRQYGQLLWVSVQILGSSVGGVVSNALHALLPNGFTIAVTTACFAVTVDNGLIENGRIAPSVVTNTVLRFVKPNAGNWAASVNNTSITAQGWFAIN